MTAAYLAIAAIQGLYFLLLARTLGAAEFGVFSGALALASTLSALAGLGAGQMLVMQTSRNRDAYRAQFGTALVYVLLTFFPLALVAVWVASSSMQAFVATLMPLLVSELLFARVFDYGLQSFQAHDRLKGNAVLGVAAAAVRLVIVVIFVVVGGREAADWAWMYAATSTAIAIVTVAVCWRLFGTPALNASSLKRTWRTGVFFSLGMASRTVYTDADKFLLVQMGLSREAGQFSVAHRVMNMAFMPIQAIVYSANTRLFRAGHVGYEQTWMEVRRLLVLVVGYGALAGGALVVISPLLPILLGESYTESAAMLPLLAPILLSQGIHYLFGDALMGLGKQNLRSVSQALFAVASVAANIMLIPMFGWAAAAGTALLGSYGLAILMTVIFLVGLRRARGASQRVKPQPSGDEGDLLPTALGPQGRLKPLTPGVN
jgi:O-antigen/teichoic acid export membrane protein